MLYVGRLFLKKKTPGQRVYDFRGHSNFVSFFLVLPLERISKTAKKGKPHAFEYSLTLRLIKGLSHQIFKAIL